MEQTDVAKENYETTLSGWRHSAAWTYGIMLFFSAVALVTSLILSAETLALARAPKKLLSCDFNSVVSCSRVAQTWQAEIVKFGELSFPNAFFGIAAESVFVTLAVIGMIRVRVPRWFAICTWLGGLCALVYAYWLFSQSMFVIHALCPWCIVLMFSTTMQFISLTHASVSSQKLLVKRFSLVESYYRLRYDLLIDVLWIAALLTLILCQYSKVFFG
ncbi:vitamin K epoxide reductase family protein [Gardnerella swidsinskii]|uniref:vitamin K epoxide reductase family protein n=1 Tax=Gardnerella TaxID=2701 RepID=UPI000E69E1D4|nr:vitamin K epoxide reductase family protein [Gardnerella swidsinskii]RIY28532.1 hypothetical protein CJI49_06700 [Bifidobacteriaceae bacterium NR016]